MPPRLKTAPCQEPHVLGQAQMFLEQEQSGEQGILLARLHQQQHRWSQAQNVLEKLLKVHLQALLPLFSTYPQFNFYSFQVGKDALQMHGFNAPITDLQPLIHDFYHTACLLEHMDLVISVDTAVAHLAGALRWPTWLLLAQGPDWRWGLNSTYSDWYPSMRLFRQEKLLDWDPVLQKLSNAVRNYF